MGRDCDFCHRRFPIDGDFGDRFAVAITVKRDAYTIARHGGDVAYGPFTYYHAPWYIESRDCPENYKRLRQLQRENQEEYSIVRHGYALNWDKVYTGDHVGSNSPFERCFMFQEGMCLGCAMKYMPYFQEDGTPNEALRNHIHMYFWDDPEPRMQWYVDGKECTRSEFFDAFQKRQYDEVDVWDDGVYYE